VSVIQVAEPLFQTAHIPADFIDDAGDAADDLAGPLEAPTPGAPKEPPAPPPLISAIIVGPELDVSLLWSSTPGRTCMVESKNDIADAAWEPIGQVTASGSKTAFVIPDAGGQSTRFYRVGLVQSHRL
jgi:hypothetical protein